MNIIENIVITEDVTLISLKDCPDHIGFLSDLFDIISSAGINVDMISQNPAKGGYVDVSFTVSADQLADILACASKIRELDSNIKIDIRSGNCKISVSGEDMRNHYGVATKIFNVAKELGINITLITTSEIDISLLVENINFEGFDKAIKDKFKE